jgi:hypothetical protein
MEMIEKYYAAHIKTSLDTAPINVKAQAKQERQESDPEHSGFTATYGS